MPGKRGGNGSGRVLPRPKRPPVLAVAPARPKPGGTGPLNLAGALGALGGAVVGGVKQMGSDAVWSVTHPKERLLGQGRAQGTAVTDPRTGKTYYLSAGEVAGSGLSAARLGRLANAAAKAKGLPPGKAKLAQIQMQKLTEQATHDRMLNFGDRPMIDDLMKTALPLPKNGKFKPGRTYVAYDRKAGRRMPDMGVENRLTIITDPKTGTTFLAPARGIHHAEVETMVDRMGYNTPGKWLQHEAWDADAAQDLPSRMFWSVYSGKAPKVEGRPGMSFGSAFGGNDNAFQLMSEGAGIPTRRAAIAQARLLKGLREQGRKGFRADNIGRSVDNN